MATWKFIVTDLKYAAISELTDYFDMTIGRRLNAADSGSFRVRADNPLFATLASQKCIVKGYRDGVLQCNMYVWTAEMQGDGERISLAVTLASPSVVMEHMYQWDGLRPLLGLDPPRPFNTTADRYRMFYHLFTYALIQRSRQAVDPSLLAMKGPYYASYVAAFTELPTNPLMAPYANYGVNMVYDDYEDRTANTPMSDRLAKFSAGTSGFDWYWEPIEPQFYYTSMTEADNILGAGSGNLSTPIPPVDHEVWTPATQIFNIPINTYYTQSIAYLRAGRPISQDKTSQAVFEYGTGRYNLAGFALSGTRQYQATLVGQRLAGTTAGRPQFGLYNPGTGADLTDFILRSRDWGIMTDFTQFDVSDPVYLQQLLDESTRLRQSPMRRLTITPTTILGAETDPPDFGRDFFLGDTITVRVVNPQTNDRLVDGTCRVYGVNWTIKESGAETMAVTIQPEAS